MVDRFLTFLSWRFYLIGLSLIVGLYIALSFYQINLPGLHYDEAFEAVPALQLLLGQPVIAFRGGQLALNRQNFPLMTQDYIGAINTYAALPFIALLGATPAALRTMSIGVGAITLVLTYLLASYLAHNRGVGLAASLLLAVEPTFVFWNRQGIFVTAVTAPIGLAAAYCWLRRFQGGSRYWSLAGAFLFGLGLYAKFLFLWLIFALVGAALLLNLPGWQPRRILKGTFRASKLILLEIGGCLVAFGLGCWPLIVYNWQTGGTLLSITQNASTSYYGVNNLAFGANLGARLGQFIILLNGGHLWYLGQVIRNFWAVFGFFVLLGLIVIMTIRMQLRDKTGTNNVACGMHPAHQAELKAALFPFLVIALTVLASIGTVSGLWITHFAILIPWPALALAVGSYWLLSRLDLWTARARLFVKWGVWLGLGLLVLSNLANTVRYHLTLTESGGLSSHSDAIYDLSDWLARHADQPVVAMDWGLAAPVTYLTAGQVIPTEVFGYAWHSDVQLGDRLEQFIHQPETFYLWRAPDEVIFDRSGEFKTLYQPRNLEETIEEAFYERSGRPLLGVTRLVEKGTASNPPK